MEESTKFTRNTRILIIGEFITFVLSFGCNFIIIRFLSVEDFSIYNLVLVVPTILLYIGDFGLFHGCSYYVARLSKLKKKEESQNVIKITLVTKSILGIGLTMIFYFLAEEISSSLLGIQNQSLIPLFQLATVLILTKNLLQGVHSILIGSANMRFYTIVNIVQHITRFISTILLILLGWTLFGPIMGSILATGIAGLLGLIYIQKNLLKRVGNKQSVDWKCLPKLVKKGFSFSLISTINNVKYEVFILIFAIFGFYTEISYLKVGVAITSIFYVILRPVMISLFPIFSKYSWSILSERTTLTQVFQYSIKFCILFISPVIIFCIIFASELVPLIFGMNYLVGSHFISIFLFYYLPLTIGMVVVPTFLFGQGHSRLALLIEFFSFSASIILGICFSLFLESFGFAIGISLGTFLGLMLGIFSTNRIFGKDLFSRNKDSILIVAIGVLLCGFFLAGFYVFSLIIVLENPFLKLLVLGGVFVCFYILFFIVLIRINLIKDQEILYFIREFQKVPIINRVLHFFNVIAKKMWKKEK